MSGRLMAVFRLRPRYRGQGARSKSSSRVAVVELRLPVLVAVLAAIAIPVELRPLGSAAFGFEIKALHFLENVAGFIVLVWALGERGFLRAVITGAMISVSAEIGQLFMMHRDPALDDIMANTIGAVIGAAISTRWKIRSPCLRIGKWLAIAALAAAASLVFVGWPSSFDLANPRGVSSPGVLEACWRFDEASGRRALDSSGHQLAGTLQNGVKRVPGIRGAAISLGGTNDYIDFGHSQAFRFTGSMTVTAWIKPASFPKDDAAIVSQFQNDLGYQLDTTVDRGYRSVGFKLTNSCGDLIARYGATALKTGVWYYVAGVYDAPGRTLDVYLNGQLDDGSLLGAVTGTQRSSRSRVYIGRRTDRRGFDFSGLIDEVHLYSFPLTREQIKEDMAGAVSKGADFGNHPVRPSDAHDPCEISSDSEDAQMPFLAALLGVLVAVGCVGLRTPARTLLCCGASLAAGFLVLHLMSPGAPAFNDVTIPLVSLAGGISVAVSVRS